MKTIDAIEQSVLDLGRCDEKIQPMDLFELRTFHGWLNDFEQ